MNFLINFIEKKKDLFKKENIFFILLATVIFIFDRLSKKYIKENFSDTSYYVNNYINFDLIWNAGIGFGLFSTNSFLIYNLVTFLIGIVIIFLLYVFIKSKKIDKFIYTLIIGGALGNFYDRLIYNAVPDFIDVHYNNFHWFTFNLADIFISVGIIIFIMRSFFLESRK